MAHRAASTALAAGLLVVAVLTGFDLAWGSERVVIAAVVVAPFVTALLGHPRETLVVGALAFAVAAVSATWNDNALDPDWFLRLAVIASGTGFAFLGARSRERMRLDSARFRLLRAAAELGDATATVDETVRRVNELLVPELADVCAIDVVRDGRTERLAIATDGPAPAELGSLDATQRITVELRARRRSIGTLTLAVTDASGRRYDADDTEFVRVLAGRIALALDNAGLSTEVETLAAQLTAALGTLAEAVTIQDRGGNLVYANDAAAQALGFDSPEELLATPPQEIVDAFESYHEDGTPLDLSRLPGRQVLEGREAEPLLIRAINRRTGEEHWRLTKATAVLDRDGRPLLAVNVIEDLTEVKRAEATQRFLAQATELLTSSLDYSETLARVARLAVPGLADWCVVSMPDGHGYLRAVAVAHVDPAKVRIAEDYNRRFPPRVTDPGGSAEVLRTGASQVLNEIPDELLRERVSDPERLEVLRSLGMRAAMLVPMVAASGVIGVISFVSAESGRPFSSADLELAEELGRRAGAAVENARLYTERSRIAYALQMSLLPGALPDVPGFELAALYRPAGMESFVGGDFYDALPVDDGWMVIVGDVTGRGAEAAALTAQARHTLRTAGTLLGDPVAAIERLNRALVEQAGLPICTVAALLLREDEDSATVEIACAGHPQPLRVRGDEVEPVGGTGPMVGAWADATWTSTTIDLAPGDLLVLYTDGVIDAVGEGGRFGEDRLVEAVRGVPDAAGVVAAVQSALRSFERGEQADDTAVLAVQRVPAPVHARTA